MLNRRVPRWRSFGNALPGNDNRDAEVEVCATRVGAILSLVNWLVFSVIASVALTVVLNLALRLIPGAGDRATRRMATWAANEPDERYDRSPDQRRVRVFFPWKLMLIGSLLLTVVVNALSRFG